MGLDQTIEQLGSLMLRKYAMGKAVVRVIPDDGTKPVVINAEITETPDEKRRGLMFRKGLPDGEGMLFPFGFPAPRTFWMKNVPIPLDMIFADGEGTIVHIEHEAEPYSELPQGPNRPVQFVLEVPGGFCRRARIEIGQRLEVEGV